MSKQTLTVFLCTNKDCSKAWRRVCDGSPGKWLKRQVEAAGLPYRLTIVETECMDHCDDAACLCLVHGNRASLQLRVHHRDDAERLVAACRDVVGDGWQPVQSSSVVPLREQNKPQ